MENNHPWTYDSEPEPFEEKPVKKEKKPFGIGKLIAVALVCYNNL